MTTYAIHQKTKRLLTQLAVLEGVLNGSLAAICVPTLHRSLFQQAASLREEMAAPVTITPSVPYSPGAAS